MATVMEVNQFLRRFKAQINSKRLMLIPRKINMDGLASLGLTITDAKAVILALSYFDYSEGPEADEDGSMGEVWIFGVTLSKQSVYIKLKLEMDEAKCLSFHPAISHIRKPYDLGGKP